MGPEADRARARVLTGGALMRAWWSVAGLVYSSISDRGRSLKATEPLTASSCRSRLRGEQICGHERTAAGPLREDPQCEVAKLPDWHIGSTRLERCIQAMGTDTSCTVRFRCPADRPRRHPTSSRISEITANAASAWSIGIPW